MNDIKDIIKKPVETISARFDDPVIGPFLVSFVAVNWKFLVYLLSGKNVDEKVFTLERLLITELYSITNGFTIQKVLANAALILSSPFILPLLLTFFYIYILPRFLVNFYDRVWKLNVQLDNLKTRANLELDSIEKIVRNLELSLARETDRNNSLNELEESRKQNLQLLEEKNRGLEREIAKLRRHVALPTATINSEIELAGIQLGFTQLELKGINSYMVEKNLNNEEVEIHFTNKLKLVLSHFFANIPADKLKRDFSNHVIDAINNGRLDLAFTLFHSVTFPNLA